MFPWLRFLRVGLRLLAAPRIGIFTTTRVSLRIWPNDLDLNRHVNNGRYLTLADIGRLDWFVRTGALGVARRHKAFPVVGDAIAKFRRDLKAFQLFEIHTRLLGWDRKWGYIEHRFLRHDRVIGVVMIRGVFKGPGGAVDPGVLLTGLSHSTPSPELPEWAAHFERSSERLSALLREEERAPLRGNAE